MRRKRTNGSFVKRLHGKTTTRRRDRQDRRRTGNCPEPVSPNPGRFQGISSRIKDLYRFIVAKKKMEKEMGSCPKIYFSLFPITLSHFHSQSCSPNIVNRKWWQSTCRKLLLRIRPFSETTSHSTMTSVLFFPLGQRIDFHSLSIFCSKKSLLLTNQ